jgi:hypothetical protein
MTEHAHVAFDSDTTGVADDKILFTTTRAPPYHARDGASRHCSHRAIYSGAGTYMLDLFEHTHSSTESLLGSSWLRRSTTIIGGVGVGSSSRLLRPCQLLRQEHQRLLGSLRTESAPAQHRDIVTSRGEPRPCRDHRHHHGHAVSVTHLHVQAPQAFHQAGTHGGDGRHPLWQRRPEAVVHGALGLASARAARRLIDILRRRRIRPRMRGSAWARAAPSADAARARGQRVCTQRTCSGFQTAAAALTAADSRARPSSAGLASTVRREPSSASYTEGTSLPPSHPATQPRTALSRRARVHRRGGQTGAGRNGQAQLRGHKQAHLMESPSAVCAKRGPRRYARAAHANGMSRNVGERQSLLWFLS